MRRVGVTFWAVGLCVSRYPVVDATAKEWTAEADDIDDVCGTESCNKDADHDMLPIHVVHDYLQTYIVVGSRAGTAGNERFLGELS